ncbi:TPA: MFS transporter [Photobacterium damselae]
MSQFSLMKKGHFLPYFLTQALGAFNDNLFKNILLLFVVFSALYSQQHSTMLVNVAAGLFILPFFLLSPIGGQLADKYEKSRLIRIIKACEIVIMTFAAGALWLQSVPAMLLALFLTGAQSAFFGPVKFALLPQHLSEKEIVGGNALVEMGTFIAILGGTLYAGYLFEYSHNVALVAGGSVVILSILGYLSSRAIPYAAANNPNLVINWNPITQVTKTYKAAKANRTVFLSILAISWFWFLGATYLTQLPNFSKLFISAEPKYVSLLLTLFSIGIALGSLACEKLSNHHIELGIIPIGALGISIFGIEFYFAAQHIAISDTMTVWGFITNNLRLVMDLILISAFSAIYVVPLNALIQERSDKESQAQVIAANNVMNAFFMVLSAAVSILMLSVFKLSIPQFLLVVAVVNIFVTLYVFAQVQEFLVRFVVWVVTHIMYRIKVKGTENIPSEGAAVLVCNHVSYVDALLIAATCNRPVRFVMDKDIANMPVMKYFFRWAKTIPICAAGKSPSIYKKAFKTIAEDLEAGEIVCIFPEGKLTWSGELNEFRRGIERIIEQTPVPVIPMGLKGVWGSFFSHEGGRAFTTRPKRFWSKLEVVVDKPVAPQHVSAPMLQEIVQELVYGQPSLQQDMLSTPE